MSTTARNHRLGLTATLIVSALSLGALTLPLSSANAQCLGVDLGFGCAGLGVGSWYTPYYRGYPYPYYYGQPYYYGYPVGPGPYSYHFGTE